MSSIAEKEILPVKNPWPYLALLFFTYILTNFNANRLQPILPIVMQTLNINVAQAGILISAATFLNIFITIPIGLAITKIGLRRAGLLSMGFLFCGTLIGSFFTGYVQIIIAMLLGGIGNVFIAVSGIVFINLLFGKNNHATATSIFTASNTTAQFVTFFILPRITSVGNIKPAWRIDLVLSLVSFFLWIIFIKKPFVNQLMEKQAKEHADDKSDTDDSSARSLYVKKALTNPDVWKLFSSVFLFMIGAIGVLGYLPSYLVAERGFELKYASFLCGFNAFVGFGCAICAGILADRLKTNKWIFFTAAVIMASLRIFQITVPTGPLLVMVTILQGIPAAGSGMVFSAVTKAIADPKEKSVSVSMVMTGLLSGIALSPTIFGSLVRAFGYNTSFLIMVPITLLSLIGIFSVKSVK